MTYKTLEQVKEECADLIAAGWVTWQIRSGLEFDDSPNGIGRPTHTALTKGPGEYIDQHPEGGWVVGRYIPDKYPYMVFDTALVAAVAATLDAAARL